MNQVNDHSNNSAGWIARDSEALLAWRIQPSIVLEKGQGCVVTDVDGNDYYDTNAGMMCLVLGHSHPEITEVITV